MSGNRISEAPEAKVVYWWLRRDLRLEDNAALARAAASGLPIQPVFIFDRNILDTLPRQDRRVVFLHRRLAELNRRLWEAAGAGIRFETGSPEAVWDRIFKEGNAAALYAGQDYEPCARQRDENVAQLARAKGIGFHLFKDHLVFHADDLRTGQGTSYGVYTPYQKAWLNAFRPEMLAENATEKAFALFVRAAAPLPIPSLQALGFEDDPGLVFPDAALSDSLLERYAQTRDFPVVADTSRLGLHLRFGTLSIRKVMAQAMGGSEAFRNELIWREFFSQVLWHHPRVVREAYRKAYDRICWRDAPEDLERWKSGHTGYPLVDAGMRELEATGHMHNRIRMVTASFLAKHLLLDWRLGEAHFAEKLLDFDLASNNGNWQWAAGCGTDAAPYFRIFNPTEQARKFDPHSAYIRRWVPELGTSRYPAPMVEHAFARARALEVYQAALKP